MLQERHGQEIRFAAQHHPYPDAPPRRQGEDGALHPGAGGAAPPTGGPGEEPRVREQQVDQARAVAIQGWAGGPSPAGDPAQHVAGERRRRRGVEPAFGLRARGAGPPELQEGELRPEPELRAPTRQEAEQGAPELGLVPEPGQLAGEGARQGHGH